MCTQKNPLSETVLLSTQNIYVKTEARKYFDFKLKIVAYLSLSIYFQMKTVSVALVLCLNVGVDPPDVVKISPCARLECWIGKMYCHHVHKFQKY